MTYEKINKVGSPRRYLLSILIEKGFYSEYEKEGFTKITNDSAGYYFSKEVIDKNFDLQNCTNGKTSFEFMKKTGYSRPKINSFIEKHNRIVYLEPGFYDFENLKEFLKENISNFKEMRGITGRPRKDGSNIENYYKNKDC